MAIEHQEAAVEFCADSELGYDRSRTRFVPGEGLALDEQYRLVHLPLVAPDHPAIIPTRAGTFYERGRHPRVVSLVVPVPWDALSASREFQELERDLRGAPFAAKIAWEVMARRRDRLHATLSGSLTIGRDAAPEVTAAQRRQLAEIGPIRVDLRGLFSGNVNLGRLYLRAYPARRNGANPFRAIQRIFGRPETDLYVVGLYNLTDDLTATEASALAALIARWWDRSILQIEISSLWLIWTMDALVLDGGVAQEVPLGV